MGCDWRSPQLHKPMNQRDQQATEKQVYAVRRFMADAHKGCNVSRPCANASGEFVDGHRKGEVAHVQRFNWALRARLERTPNVGCCR